MWVLWIFCLVCILYYLTTRKFTYWKKRKVPHLKPVPLLGNYGDYILLKTAVGVVVKKICEKFPREPYIGAYFGTEPVLIVQDPNLIKLIMSKDFYYFSGRETSEYSEREALMSNIFFQHGDKWKVLRQNLSPLYTTAKMKNMFPLIEKCTYMFDKLLKDEVSSASTIDVIDLMARFTIDCVSTCGFGVDANVMQKGGENNEFRMMGERIFTNSTYRGFKNIFRAIWPSLFYMLRLKMYPTELRDFFLKLFAGIFEKRGYKPTSRQDFVDSILTFCTEEHISGDSIIKLKTGESKKICVKVNNNLLVGQCIAFFGAGFETSATTAALTLFEIAKSEEAQERVLQEVDNYLQKHNYKLGYECVTELPYLEACIDEALRFYPTLPNLTREVMEDYTFPTGLRVEKGLRIHLPVYHMHRNPEHFPEPEKFRPERFLPSEKHKIRPFTYMPFGEGYRICIAMRFAKMQILAGLVTILKNYKLQLADGMCETLDFEPRVFVTRPTKNVLLKFIQR